MIHCVLTKSHSNVQVTAEEENVLSLTNKMRSKQIFFFFLRICVQYIGLACCLDISQAIRFQLLFIKSEDGKLKKLGCWGKNRFSRKNGIL